MFATGFGLIVAVAVLGTDAEPVATEIDGDWMAVSCSINGQMITDEKAAKFANVVRLEKGYCRTAEKSKLGNPVGPDAKESEDTEDDTELKYRLNPTQDPKQIDLFFRYADGRNSRSGQGIYRLKDDELVICFTVTESKIAANERFDDGTPNYDPADSPRPTTFEPALHMIWTLKRSPAEKESP